MIKGTVRPSELNSFVSIRACRPWRVISARDLVSRGFDSVVISKRVCGVRLFGIFEKI